MEELAEIAETRGINIIITGELKIQISSRNAILFYNLCYKIMDWAIRVNCNQLLIHLETANGSNELRLLPSANVNSFRIDQRSLEAIRKVGGVYAVIDLGYAGGIRLSVTEKSPGGG